MGQANSVIVKDALGARRRHGGKRRFARSARLGAMALAAIAASLLLVGGAARADADEKDEAEEELVREAQNPVANLISVPFQNNFNFNTGPNDKTVWVMNVQPVIPFPINDDWNLITRTILPIINQPALFPGSDGVFGIGDVNPTAFLSPARSGKFIWGAGPSMTLPTASASEIGSGKWTMGPSAVGVVMDGPWVAGVLINQQWSFAGWGDRDVNGMLIQPFLNYNLPHGWYLNSAPIITGNFTASDGNHWTLPVGAGVGRLWRVGTIGLPINTLLAPYYNAVSPDNHPEWQLRFQVQFLFPR